MASNNMYRVGDFVYFESSAGVPYQIRKIEELNKTTTGAVEAKVVCYYRRRDEPVHDLLSKSNELVDSYYPDLGEKELHLLKHRELFVSRQLETLPATHIRGKANVLYLNEEENILDILNMENTFFYKLIYDPTQRSLHTGKGCIRRGSVYQADIPNLISDKTNFYDKDKEILKWSPKNNIDETQINNYLTVSRSLGTLARACDVASTVRQPNLAAAAAAASRDITLIHAYDMLFKTNYDLAKTIALLTPNGCPTLIRDEMEQWSAREAKLFEEGLNKYGKHFHLICRDFLPWKSISRLVEFYYMWKTSHHHLQMKRIKRSENEHRLRQVYIPNYTKPNPAVLYNEAALSSGTGPTGTGSNTSGTTGAGNSQPNTGGSGSVGCESCGNLSSGQWFVWGTLSLPCKLCEHCWSYWKRYGGLKNPSTQDKQNKDVANTSNGGSSVFQQKSLSGVINTPNTSNNVGVGNGLTTINNSISATVYMNKTITAHMYQCPQIGCDKQFRQLVQLHTHIVSFHTEVMGSLGGSIAALEEYKNQKHGFMMKASPELIVSRRLLKRFLQPNFRLGRCFDYEKRCLLAKKSVTRHQLYDIFRDSWVSNKKSFVAGSVIGKPMINLSASDPAGAVNETNSIFSISSKTKKLDTELSVVIDRIKNRKQSAICNGAIVGSKRGSDASHQSKVRTDSPNIILSTIDERKE